MKNKENGITLIALIITIIVMLILVGVTINIALNGGLFQKAKIAADGTQKEVEREELIVAMVGAYDSTGSFDIDNLDDLPEEAKWCTKEDITYSETTEANPTEGESWTGSWVITKNNNKFYIDINGAVLEQEPEKNNPWIGWGLDSSKVKYDVSYTGSASALGIGSAEIKIHSDGRLLVSWDNKTYTKAEVENKIGNDWFVEDNIFYIASANISFEYEQEKDENNKDIGVVNFYSLASVNVNTNDLKTSLGSSGTLLDNCKLIEQD